MVKKKVLAIILILFLVIGIIHGLIIAISLNIFISWFLIGLWIIFTIKIFENVKRHREFNSPHNTAFFVILPLFIGIFYSIWGYFTGILDENFLEGSNLYFSVWSIIFGFPFVLYGSHSLYRCFKKYNVVYFGTKSVNARLLGFILAFLVLVFILFYWIGFYTFFEFYNSPLTPLHFSLNLNLLILLIATLMILIVYGFIRAQRSLPALTRDYIAQRTKRINSLTSPTVSNSPRDQRLRTRTTEISRPSSRTTTRTTRSRVQSSRATPTSHRNTTRTRATTTKRTTSVKRASKGGNLNRYKPIASFLSEEDFKCIFCFKLPKLPEDKGRGIILCPNCKYPAHADEFKDWARTSNLCSRCSAPIPLNFRRNPRIISVKNYTIIYRHYLNKKK